VAHRSSDLSQPTTPLFPAQAGTQAF
jgi:hypothetical protein